MSEERSTLRYIDWRELCPWLLILKSFRLAVGIRVLVLAFAGLLASTAGWDLIGWAFGGSSDVQLQTWISQDTAWPGYLLFPSLTPETRTAMPTGAAHSLVPSGLPNPDGDPMPAGLPSLSPDSLINNSFFSTVWKRFSLPFVRIFNLDMTFARLAYLLLICLWSLLVWSLFGGAIVRLSAVALAREDRLPLRPALGFAQRKWFGLFAAPLFPFIGVFLAAIPLCLVGLLFNLNFFVALSVVIWPFVLLAGIFMAILLLGLLFGWPLMWGTIGTEGTDAFDALSRSYNYIREKPLHYLFYILVAAGIGALGSVLVALFAYAIIHLATWGVNWGMPSQRITEIYNTSDSFGRNAMGFWNGCVYGFAVACLIGYFWSAMAAVYLLMRKKVDATELDEVYVEEEEQPYGMPPLVTDSSGVPRVADTPPSEPGPLAEEQE
ncbi:MAG TPA: hypothetical protein VFE24_04425 [Pirellulales bacterium]|jgi:hypothetical protein|nr:hypothetical protein [Pirellulales bacterium]